MRVRPLVAAVHLDRPMWALGAMVTVAIGLETAAAIGLAYIVGFRRVLAVLAGFQPDWLIPLAGALLLSFAGYFLAYRGIFAAEGGSAPAGRNLRAVVVADFGGFLAHGTSVLGESVLRADGTDEREAKVRLAALSGLEQGVLALASTAAAIAVLAAGLGKPPPSFTVPWAVLPVPGFLVAFWLAARHRARFASRDRRHSRVGIFLDAVHLIRALFASPLRYGLALAGMTIFWAGDALAAWAGLAAFGQRMSLAALFVGFATGMICTRRIAPLAGAGLLGLVLPLMLWASGASIATAVAGVFVYRVLVLVLPLPASLSVRRTLRDLQSQRSSGGARTGAQSARVATRAGVPRCDRKLSGRCRPPLRVPTAARHGPTGPPAQPPR
jgi:hypothetical protein